MSAVTLFENGTPEAAGEALQRYRLETQALNATSELFWYVDPQNLGLLSRAISEMEQSASKRVVTVVLSARDIDDQRTVVADEGILVPTLRRIVNGVSPAINIRLRLKSGRPYYLPPPALDVSTNDLCGLACNMCGNRAPKRDPETISPEAVRSLVREAADWGIRRVALTGAGEPFRDPEMLGHIQFANSLGHLVTITTNGFQISEKVASELGSRVVSISVSIHGATDKTHDSIVGIPKAADNAWRAVARMVKARDALGGLSKLSVNVSTVIQKENLSEIPDLVRRAHQAGCNGINIQPVNLQHGSFSGDVISRRDDLILLGSLWPGRGSSADLDRVFEELASLKTQLGKFMHAPSERLALFRRYFENSSRESLGTSCRVGEAFLAVDHRGQIKPCYRLPWSHGDARLKSVREVWNSEAYARTRASIDGCPLTCMNNCFFRDGKKLS